MQKSFAISKNNFTLALRAFITDYETYFDEAWKALAGTEVFEYMPRTGADDLAAGLAFSSALMDVSGYSRSLSGDYLSTHLETVEKAVSITSEARARGGLKKLI